MLTPGYCEKCGTHNGKHTVICSENYLNWQSCGKCDDRISCFIDSTRCFMKPKTILNHAAHEALTIAGYDYTHFDCTFEDIGDPENGPELTGHPSFDLYADADSYVYISEGGDTAYEIRDLEFEAHCERMGQ